MEKKISVRDVTVLHGHKKITSVCTWHPAIDILASGSRDNTVRLWAKTPNSMGFSTKLLEGFASETNTFGGYSKALRWSPQGILGVGAEDGSINLWNADGELLMSLEDNNETVSTLAWSRKGNYIAAVAENEMWLWDTRSTNCIRHISQSKKILDVDWQTDSTYACCYGRTIKIHTLQPDRAITLTEHTQELNSIKWDYKGRLLASCSDDETIKIWSPEEERSIISLSGHSYPVHSIIWSPVDSKTVVSANFGSIIKIWDIEKGACTYNLDAATNELINSISMSPDGKFLASGGHDGVIRIWSTENEKPLFRHKTCSQIFAVEWNNKGNKIAASEGNGHVNVIDAYNLTNNF